jgi:Terminase large subunit, T4likevirus-type, N-terminal
MISPPTTELPPGVNIMRHLGMEPDPWQIEVLESAHPRLLLNCCRQAGKSTVVAVLALVHALFRPMIKVVILSRSQRQANELLRQVKFFHLLLRERCKSRVTAHELEFTNLSRIISLPCKEETIRGFAHVDILILDEAARVPDDLYRAVRPMLAVSEGRMICLSTPHGKRGFFWNAWARGGADWQRIEIPASKCPRIKPGFLAEERRALGESWYRQEYECSFEALEGLVYPDFARCVVPQVSSQWSVVSSQWQAMSQLWEQRNGRRPMDVAQASSLVAGSSLVPPQRDYSSGRRDSTSEDACATVTEGVGGIDFGFRNPFAAIWGFVDRDDVLWLVGEHYGKLKPLSWHAQHLPRNVTWYADPSAAN